MKFRYDESFLFPQGQEDYGRGLMFPQGQLSGSVEKTVYQNRFLFPAGGSDTDHGETLMFPQGKLHGIGRVSDANNPVVQTHFGNQTLYLIDDQVAAAQSQYPDVPVDGSGNLKRSDWIRFLISKAFANPTTDYDKRARTEYETMLADLLAYEQSEAGQQVVSAASRDAAAQQAAAYAAMNQAAAEAAARAQAEAEAQQAAAQQAAAQQAAAQRAANDAAQRAAYEAAAKADKAAAEAAAAAAREPVSLTIDVLSDGTTVLIGKLKDGTSIEVSRGPGVDPWLTSRKLTRDSAGQTAAYVKTVQAAAAAADTHKTAVDTSTATVQHTDTASGTTSTVNAATGAVTVTTPSGATATGKGTVTAGGVTTTVDTKTGVVTTQNTATGVATQTNAATGQTQTAVQITGTAATGGTFMLPGGETVTTTKPITATGLSAGHIALAALLGVLLLRGAVR